jgi:hypothetical protein
MNLIGLKIILTMIFVSIFCVNINNKKFNIFTGITFFIVGCGIVGTWIWF